MIFLGIFPPIFVSCVVPHCVENKILPLYLVGEIGKHVKEKWETYPYSSKSHNQLPYIQGRFIKEKHSHLLWLWFYMIGIEEPKIQDELPIFTYLFNEAGIGV